MAAPKARQLLALRNLSRGSAQYRSVAGSLRTEIDRPNRVAVEHSRTPRSVRQFSVSHQMRAPNDSSTIDFARLPVTAPPEEEEIMRVPILPTTYRNADYLKEEDDSVMKAEISTASGDTVFQPVADLSDGHGLNIDFHAMADRVAMNLKENKVSPEEQASIMKQIWSDMVDDMFGFNKNKADGGSK